MDDLQRLAVLRAEGRAQRLVTLDQRVDAALQHVDPQVAQAVEAPRPHEAIRQYLLLAEDLIEHRSRGSYTEAAHLLQQVRKLYHGLGEEDRWQQIINGLRQEYRRLPAFLDELRRAGL